MWCLPLWLRGQGEVAGGIGSVLRANSIEMEEAMAGCPQRQLGCCLASQALLVHLSYHAGLTSPFPVLPVPHSVLGFAFPGPMGTPVLGADHGAQASLGTAPCEVPVPVADRCQQLPASPSKCCVSVSHAGESETTLSHSSPLKFETREVEGPSEHFMTHFVYLESHSQRD